jgi:hypothetical protein
MKAVSPPRFLTVTSLSPISTPIPTSACGGQIGIRLRIHFGYNVAVTRARQHRERPSAFDVAQHCGLLGKELTG